MAEPACDFTAARRKGRCEAKGAFAKVPAAGLSWLPEEGRKPSPRTVGRWALPVSDRAAAVLSQNAPPHGDEEEPLRGEPLLSSRGR